MVKKKLRYRVVTINGDHYLIDIGYPFWKGLLPYGFWLFPQTGFRLKDEKVLNDLEVAKNEGSGKVTTLTGIGVGLSFFLRPIMDHLNMPTSRILNGVILLFALTVILFSHLYYNRINKENLTQILDVKQLKTEKLVIRPKSISHFVIYTFLYTVIVGLSILFFTGFIESGNIILLLCCMSFFYLILLCGAIMVAPHKTYGKLANTN
ncbi:DUF443 domain-containing protein [Salipaludibacillus sp. LMS25]|uniref:DUF443 family protein n=1 Tax=Salipaludibacillus sp. LMS25 TaxID=2924031 RepID=UPI0020D11DCA|nr:DUF443 family protein [Salipaludibacillus sp. LMS25]UTR13824.1 DUF443 domain-containing protein [Salipaludibacillus sp. LMS25]